MECKFFHTLEGSAGFAVMTYSYQFFAVADSDRSRDELRVKKLADLPSKQLYSQPSHAAHCFLHLQLVSLPPSLSPAVPFSLPPSFPPHSLPPFPPKAVSTKPSCWAVLPQSNILNVVAAVEDRLYVIDPFEATQKVIKLIVHSLHAHLHSQILIKVHTVCTFRRACVLVDMTQSIKFMLVKILPRLCLHSCMCHELLSLSRSLIQNFVLQRFCPLSSSL